MTLTLTEMLELCSLFATKPTFEELPLDEGRRCWQQEKVVTDCQMHTGSIHLPQSRAAHPLSPVSSLTLRLTLCGSLC